MKFEDDIVLVNGSNGRIGDAVMQRLSRRFYNVVGLNRKAPGPPPDWACIPVDIASASEINCDIDACFHLWADG